MSNLAVHFYACGLTAMPQMVFLQQLGLKSKHLRPHGFLML
jgi:hypothetical protein